MKLPHALALAAGLSVLLLCAQARAINIVPTFVNSSDQSWTTTEEAVINQAIGEWEARILDPFTIDITFDLVHAGGLSQGGYLGLWEGSPDGRSYPWSASVTHMVHFNEDLMDPTLPNYLQFTTGQVDPSNWDALTVIRHELGHAMGFVADFYFDQNNNDKWTSHVVGSTFDPGGLNVQMDNASDLSHVANTGVTANNLMLPSLTNGIRRDIGSIDLKMLELAYHYAMIPGDATRNGSVGFEDLVVVARNYSHTSATWDQGDFNNDGSVGFDDLVTVARNYGQTLDTYTFPTPAALEPALQSVPEPTSTVLLCVGLLALLPRRRIF